MAGCQNDRRDARKTTDPIRRIASRRRYGSKAVMSADLLQAVAGDGGDEAYPGGHLMAGEAGAACLA